MDQKLINKLVKRIEEGTLRSLSCFDGLIDFHSNDYLGLARIKTSEIEAHVGSTGSRLISGTSEEALYCEKKLEEYFSVNGALVFNSGYDANLGFFSSVPQRNDFILYDEDIHASVRDGIRLSLAKSFSFKHNDIQDLKRLLDSISGTVYVAVESLYSMKGDLAPLNEIIELCKSEHVYLIVDEAHSFGVFGENGKGLVSELGLEDKVFARLVTFGKALGSHGAAILGSKELKNYLVNFARSFIYTTALPAGAYDRISQLLKSNQSIERIALKENIEFFRKSLSGLTLVSDERSPIQMIQIGNIHEAKSLANKLIEHGLAAKAVFSPTVPEGQEGVRISIHSFNTNVEIQKLVEILVSEINT
jgi:8-amino-7-oxononanoate synthase